MAVKIQYLAKMEKFILGNSLKEIVFKLKKKREPIEIFKIQFKNKERSDYKIYSFENIIWK